MANNPLPGGSTGEDDLMYQEWMYATPQAFHPSLRDFHELYFHPESNVASNNGGCAEGSNQVNANVPPHMNVPGQAPAGAPIFAQSASRMHQPPDREAYLGTVNHLNEALTDAGHDAYANPLADWLLLSSMNAPTRPSSEILESQQGGIRANDIAEGSSHAGRRQRRFPWNIPLLNRHSTQRGESQQAGPRTSGPAESPSHIGSPLRRFSRNTPTRPPSQVGESQQSSNLNDNIAGDCCPSCAHTGSPERLYSVCSPSTLSRGDSEPAPGSVGNRGAPVTNSNPQRQVEVILEDILRELRRLGGDVEIISELLIQESD